MMTRRVDGRMGRMARSLCAAALIACWCGAALAQAPDAPVAPPDAMAALLPRDLSPWGMFLAADIVVKLVMIGLAFASLVTWTVALAKGLEVLVARRQLRRGIRVLAP